MALLTKKCEVCGAKINKLGSWLNIYLLKTGDKTIKCLKCGTEYKVNKIISFIGSFYWWGGPWLFSILGLVYFLDSFKLNLGGEVWLYAVVIYTTIEFMVMVLLPLKKIENKNEE